MTSDENNFKNNEIYVEILQDVEDCVSSNIDKIQKINKEVELDHFGLATATFALTRLNNSFNAAILLIKEGFDFEAIAICRMIFEQFALIYNIHEINDDTILKVSTTKSITSFKKFLSFSGQFYGFLSSYTHISPSLIHEYIDVPDDKPGINVKAYGSNENSNSLSLFLYLLANLYQVMAEYIYRNRLNSYEYLEIDKNGNIIPKCNIQKVKYYLEKI